MDTFNLMLKEFIGAPGETMNERATKANPRGPISLFMQRMFGPGIFENSPDKQMRGQQTERGREAPEEWNRGAKLDLMLKEYMATQTAAKKERAEAVASALMRSLTGLPMLMQDMDKFRPIPIDNSGMLKDMLMDLNKSLAPQESPRRSKRGTVDSFNPDTPGFNRKRENIRNQEREIDKRRKVI